MTSYDNSNHYQNYSLDQYDSSGSESNASSPRTLNLLDSVQKSQDLRHNYPTPSTDTSHHDTEDTNSSLSSQLNSFNQNLNDPNKLLKYNENNYANLINYGYQLNQYFNPIAPADNSHSLDNVLQSFSVANFDPNYVPNSYTANKEKETNETNKVVNKQINTDHIEIKHKSSKPQAPLHLIQPPDSESIEEATATARRNGPKRRSRTKFDKEQLDMLELAFERTHYPDVNVVDRLARLLNLSTERISVWFQNRRARFKRSKKEPKKEPSAHNPILDEHGVFDNDDNISVKSVKRTKSSNKISMEKFDEEKSEVGGNSFNENETDNDETRNEMEETPNKPSSIIQPKPIFNPITLHTSNSNSNQQRAPFPIYPPQVSKQEPYLFSNIAQPQHQYQIDYQNNNLKLPSNNETIDQNSSHTSSALSSSREPSPRPQSNLSASSADPEQQSEIKTEYVGQNNYQNFQTNFEQNNLFNIAPYHNSNFYMPHMQVYGQGLPTFQNFFQPYMDYNNFQPVNPSLQNYYQNN